MTNHTATSTLHTGSDSDHCTTYIQEYTYCLRDYFTDTSADVYYVVQRPGSIISEINVLLRLINLYFRPQCLMNLEPYICLYYFHLCYEGMDIGPSEKQCNHILNTCDKELEIVKIYGYDIYSSLSECSQTESPLDSKGCSILDNQICSNINISVNISHQPFNCHRGFFYQVKTEGCTPECSVWTPHFNTNPLMIADIVAIFSLLIGAISGVAVLLVSWIQRQNL